MPLSGTNTNMKTIEGNRESFRQLVHQYYDNAFHYIFSRVKSKEVARDILKEAFLDIWNNRTSLDPDQSFQESLQEIVEGLLLKYFESLAKDSKLKQEFFSNLKKLTRKEFLQSPKPEDCNLKSIHNNRLQEQLIHKRAATER